MATTLTLTIGGVDFLPQYQTGSVQITDQIQNQGNTLDLTIIQKVGQSAPTAGAEIILKDGSRYLFGGFITKLTPVEYGVGQVIEWAVEASDYTYLLVNKYAQESYTGQTLYYIVNDLMSQYMDGSYGMSVSGVQTGPIVSTINFNHVSLRKCFENLAKLTSFVWWVDYQKVIHFIDPATAALAPEAITDSSKNHESMTITVDVTQVRNDIIIMGGVQESSQYTQILTGDGNAREWVLLYPVTKMVSAEINVGGGGYVSQAVGVDGADSETGFDFMYNADRGSIRATATTTTPVGGVTPTLIRVKFTYPLQVITEVKSAPSIVAMQAIEGGDGIHSYMINDTTILSNAQAQQKALAELDQYANPLLQGEFITRTGLLTQPGFFAAGQAITVNLPAWGINSNVVYIIQSVVTTIDESGSALEYHYDVTFGGRLLGVVNFLQALAEPETPIDDSSQVNKIQAIAEVVTVTETIIKNNNRNIIAETVTVAETITESKFTPPFKWQPAGSAAKWNMAQWS